MRNVKGLPLFVGMIVASVFLSHATHAATLSFVSPGAGAISIGDTIDVSVRIDSQGQTVNAAQGTLDYPTGILQEVGIDHSNSIFNIWAQEPSVNSSTGEISFLGGGTNSFSGTSLYVLDVTFKVKGSGVATLDFKNAGVTAGDGTGANILDGTNPLSITVNGVSGGQSGATTTVPGVQTTTPAPVTRTAVTAVGLPAAPVLQVPLYPDQTRWYNQLGEVFMFWNLPSDVTAVETRVSHAPDLAVGQKQAQLLTGQSFGTLSDGVWYLRAQFINNIGLGNPAYYKISIDTKPPLSFQVQIDNASSDNPTPQIRYGTSDSLSGIDHYEISVDGETPIVTTSTSMTLPPQIPGMHALVVSAVDRAGNSTKGGLSFDIIPLASPQIVFSTPSVPQGEPLFISGTALPQATVSVNVLDSDKQQSVFEGTTTANGAGDWSMTVSQAVPQGNYVASVIASDSRGATSLPVRSNPIAVRDRVIFSIGPLDFDWFELFLIVVLLAVAAAAVVALLISRRAARRQAFRTIAERDVIKAIELLASQLGEAQKRFQGMSEMPATTSKTELEVFLKQAQDTVEKMKRYLGEEIEEVQ